MKFFAMEENVLKIMEKKQLIEKDMKVLEQERDLQINVRFYFKLVKRILKNDTR